MFINSLELLTRQKCKLWKTDNFRVGTARALEIGMEATTTSLKTAVAVLVVLAVATGASAQLIDLNKPAELAKALVVTKPTPPVAAGLADAAKSSGKGIENGQAPTTEAIAKILSEAPATSAPASAPVVAGETPKTTVAAFPKYLQDRIDALFAADAANDRNMADANAELVKLRDLLILAPDRAGVQIVVARRNATYARIADLQKERSSTGPLELERINIKAEARRLGINTPLNGGK